jgi:hypothetical protein
MFRVTCAAACCLVAGGVGPAGDARAEWTAERIAVVEGFQTPESVAVDPDSGTAYVSNVVTGDSPGRGPWDLDGKGFLSRLKPGGEIDVLKWREKTKRGRRLGRLNAPKGLCILPGQLRVADLRTMVYFDLARDRPGIVSRVRGAQRLNDMATDGKAVYLSDITGGEHPPSEEPLLARQALHARRLTIHHPALEEDMTFEAPIAPDIMRLIEALREHGG